MKKFSCLKVDSLETGSEMEIYMHEFYYAVKITKSKDGSLETKANTTREEVREVGLSRGRS